MSAAATPAPEQALARRYGYSPGKLAMWLFLASDAMGFVGLIGAYVVLRAQQAGPWRPFEGAWGNPEAGGLPALDPYITGANTFVLILSSYFMVRAVHAVQKGDQSGLVRWLGLVILGGATFLGVQVFEYQHLMHNGLHMFQHPYAATFYACTAFHGFHVFSGVVYLSVIWIRSLRGKYGPDNFSPVELVGLFWHFVDLVWIVIFTIIYLF